MRNWRLAGWMVVALGAVAVLGRIAIALWAFAQRCDSFCAGLSWMPFGVALFLAALGIGLLLGGLAMVSRGQMRWSTVP